MTMEDEKLKDVALNFQANINDNLLKENMELKKEIQALQTQLKESPENFNKDSATESTLNADLIDRQAVLDVLDRHTLSRMALYEIENLPSVQPQTKPYDDAISRQAAIDTAIEAADKWDGGFSVERIRIITEALNDLPPVQPKQRTCHSCNQDYADCDQFVCSECGIELQDWNRVDRDEDDGDITYHEYVFRYCPNCGSKILEETE